jgi:hypothetical protein
MRGRRSGEISTAKVTFSTFYLRSSPRFVLVDRTEGSVPTDDRKLFPNDFSSAILSLHEITRADISFIRHS